MNLQSVTAGQAMASEAAELADFSRRCFLETYAEFNTRENLDLFLSGPFDRRRLMAEVTDTNLLYLVLRTEGRIVAYATLRKAAPPAGDARDGDWEILRFYADKSLIGQGLGRQLMDYCLESIAVRQGKRVWLGVWQHNHRAIGFYKRMGFIRSGEHIFMLGNDRQTDWIVQRSVPMPGTPIFTDKPAI